MASVSYSPVALNGARVSDLLRSSSNGVTGVPLRTLGRARLGGGSGVARRRDFSVAVAAKIRKIKKHDRPWPKDPDPNVKGGILTHLSHFKPLIEKPKPVILEFEKPLLDLEQKISDVRKMAEETGMNFSDQILALEDKYQKALKELYTHLTPIQRVHIARHPNRPTFLDHVFSITDKFVELHGDRAGYDDPAVVCGIGTIDGDRYMFIGHQKGRNTKESIKRNFGMPTPHGYRKALRMMYYADHHGFPIVTFIDTPGAFADLRSEEIGQGEAIAQNLRTMFGLKVPIVSIVIGEGGSGGALAIGCANKLLMLENAVFYVASPEACAAILWKSAKAAPKAAKRLRITASELCRLKVADAVIPEPLGGAHADPSWTSERIKMAITKAMNELKKLDTPELLKHRSLKFRQMGGFQEGIQLNPKKKVNMKTSEVPNDNKTQQNLEREVEKLKQQIAKAMESDAKPPTSRMNKTIEKLQQEIDHDFSEASKFLGFNDKFAALKEKFIKASSGELMEPAFKAKLDELRSEFNQSLPKAPNYESLKKKLDLLKELAKAKGIAEKNQKASLVKEEINLKLKEVKEREDIKEKFAALKTEIQNSGVSKLEEMDTTLREKVNNLKNEIESEFALALQSMGLDVEVVNSNRIQLEEPTPSPEIKTKIEKFNKEIEKGIEQVVNSTDLKYRIAELRREMAKAGKKPDVAAQKKIAALEDQIKQTLADALDSSSLKEKHDNLKAEISEGFASAGESDGSSRQGNPEELFGDEAC